MASRKKGRRDDFDFDDDLQFDIPDFGADNPEAVSNNRKPIATGLKSAAAGFGKTFVNEARLRRTLTKSLPREYEEPISKAFEIKDGVRDLYNITGTQVSETVRETKKSIGRIARNLEGALPKAAYERMMRLAASAEDTSSRGMSKDEIEEGTINSAMVGIFAEQVKSDADNRKKDQARQVLQDAIDKRRHADMTSILGSIDQSLISMTTFQDKVATNYMKKSLELQFRTYFVQNDMLQLQTKFFQLFKDDLSAITKNTGLPDYVKKAPKEALLEHLREKTFETLSNSIAKRRNQWISGVFRKAGEKVTDTIGSVREGMGQILDTAEMASGMYGSGMGPTGSEIVGDLAGGWAGNKAQDMIAKRIRAYTSKNPKTAKFGNKLGMVFNSLPQWINQQATSGKYADKVPDWLRDILSQDGEQSGIRVNREVDLDRAAAFSDKNSRSLNVVIPELLSKIHHELYVSRTGDVKSSPLAYDYEKGKFVGKKERTQGLLKSIVDEKTTDQTKHQIDNIFREIDPDNKFDKATRNKIAESIYAANKRGVMFDRDGMMRSVDHTDAAATLKKYIEDDSSGTRERRLSGLFGRVGSANGEVSELIQHLVDSGRHGELADLGLIDLEKGTINLDMVRRMELGQDITGPLMSTVPQTPTGFGKSALGSRVKKQRGALNLGAILGKGNKDTTQVPGGAGDLAEISKMFRELMDSLNKSNGAGFTDQGSYKQIKEAIETASGKSELVEIRDILKRIEEKGMGGGIMTPEMLEQYMSERVGGFFGKAGKYGRSAVGKAAGLFKSGVQNSWNLSKKLSGVALNTGKGAFSWLGKQKDRFDLYIGNEVEPRLSKAKLEAGRYIDEASGKVIEKFEDIRGAIKDLDTGEIVLKAGEIKQAILKNMETGKSILASATSWGKSAIKFSFDQARKTADRLIGFSKTAYGTAWSGLKKAYDVLTDGPMDVYLKDSYETPVLLKRLMEQGMYFDKETLDAIFKVSQIKGPVVDNQENVLITREDLHSGLYNKNGQEIKTGFDRITQFVGNSMKKTLNTYKTILGKAKDIGAKSMAWLKGLFGFDSPFTVFSSRTNDILGAIYSLLNDRMPGDRSPDLDTLVQRSQSSPGATAGKLAEAGKNVFAKAKEQLDKTRGRAQDFKDKHWDDAATAVNERMGRGKDRVVQQWDKLYKLMDERLPEAKKKIFGDSDGDGVRDGSIDDLRKRRDKLKEQAKETAAAAKDGAKAGAVSLYGKIADLLKRKNKDEEEEDDDSGDTFVDLGLGDGDGEKKGKKSKPKGKPGMWSKLKDKITPKGKGKMARGARGLGRFALGAGKLLGRGALAWGGALLGGGAMSASILTGGLSMLGSALGMTAAAIGAVLSSPITVPALAIAAVAGAGYFAYKWLTKPDPQPLEKVRLVQYGWKANDIEAYKKMKSLEQQVKNAVVFKGENAEFDSKKLNIPEMMKIYNLDPSNAQHANKFVGWFADRFRPIYLHHRALIKTTMSPKELDEVDSNKQDFKKQYLEQCSFPGSHYSVIISPLKDQPYLFTTMGSVERQIESSQDEIKISKSDVQAEKDKSTLGAVKAKTNALMAESYARLKGEQRKDEAAKQPVQKKFDGNGEKIAELNRLKAATLGAATGPGTMGNPNNIPGNPLNGPAASTGASTQGSNSFSGGIGMKQPGNGTGGDINSIPIPKGNKSWSALKDTIVAASKMAGVDPKLAATITAVESDFDYTARPYDKATGKYWSSAKGLNQFIDGTWSSMMSKYAKKYGIDPSTSALDPRANALLGAEFMKENTESLKKDLKRPITATDVYMAHFMGVGGARKFLTSDPSASGAAVFPKEAAANPWIYYRDPKTRSGPKTLGEIYNDMTQKLSKRLSKHGYSDGDITGAVDPKKVQDENAKLLATQETGQSPAPSAPGAVPAAKTVASPKPATTSVVNNPNMGPAPSSFAPQPVTPAAMAASPRPGYDPSTTGQASRVSSEVRSSLPPSQDAFVQRNQSVNTGDSITIAKDTLAEHKTHTSLLQQMVNILEALPENIAASIGSATPNAPAKPEEKNNYNRTPTPMGAPSAAFRRQLAGK